MFFVNANPSAARRRLAGLFRAGCLAVCLSGWQGSGSAQPSPPALPPALDFLTHLPRPEPVDDWLVTPDPLAMPIRPANGAVVRQTPPDFSWPDQGRDTLYEFRLLPDGGDVAQRIVTVNYVLWPRALPPGGYGWQVRRWGRDSDPGPWSQVRRFTVPEGAYSFVVPDIDQMYERATLMLHPRTLPKAAAFERLKAELLTGGRQNRFNALLKIYEPRLGGPMTPDVGESAGHYDDIVERRKAEGRIVAATTEELETLLAMAFIAAITERGDFIDEAKRRLFNVAGWSVHGGTGNGSYGIESQTISRYMALAFDWLYHRMTATERQGVLDVIVAREATMYDWYVTEKRRLQQQPYDSHGYLHIGNIAAVAAVVAGDTAAARSWLRDTLPLYLSITNPWGGETGGYANGMNYAFYDVQYSFQHWDILREVLGVDVTQKAWTRNFALTMMYMQPPGAPSFVFGDAAGNGDTALVSTVARAYALRAPGAIANWYAAQQNVRFPVPRIYELMSPVPEPSAARRASGPSPDLLPNAAVFPDVGWVAMHSNLRDSMRNSVYFKSSDYGSYNHGHADQNSFVIQSRGRDLVIDSGYFYLYNSPHWTNWTKQTMAHNAITFDGGKGQTFDDRGATGVLTRFASNGLFDVVTGDATRAYGEEIDKAIRTLMFLRPDTVLVYDSLAGRNPTRFEWNIHAKNNMVAYDPGKIGFVEGDASVCVEMHDPGRLDFTKFDGFGPDAVLDEEYRYLPTQWHGRFVVRVPEQRTEFLALLRIGCAGPGLSDVVPRDGGGFTLALGNRRFGIGENGAELLP